MTRFVKKSKKNLKNLARIVDYFDFIAYNIASTKDKRVLTKSKKEVVYGT